MPIYPASGVAVDDATITENSSSELEVKPSTIIQNSSLVDITYSSNTTLISDVYANNVTINSGVTITTNGYNFYCMGTFTNNGTINTNFTGTTNGANILTSYGGSGGGGASTGGGNPGGATTVAGGSGSPADGSGGNGNTATAPILTNSLINNWYSNGMSNYLEGAGGGAGVDTGPSGGGGIYIQANTLIAGTIITTGETGSSGGGTGGGGAGSILLAYGPGGLTAGTYTLTGGSGSSYSNGTGGNGGNGIVMTFSGMPIIIPAFSYTTISNSIKNRNSSYQHLIFPTTSTTSPQTLIAQQITPTTSGLIAIRAVVNVYNNTIGDGVAVYLYNGSTLLDSDSYTQEGLINNPHYITLYTEQQFNSPFSTQTYSIQFNAVTGGTASCEIQEFTIEEIY